MRDEKEEGAFKGKKEKGRKSGDVKEEEENYRYS